MWLAILELTVRFVVVGDVRSNDAEYIADEQDCAAGSEFWRCHCGGVLFAVQCALLATLIDGVRAVVLS